MSQLRPALLALLCGLALPARALLLPGTHTGAIAVVTGVVYHTVGGQDLRLDLACPAQDPASTNLTAALLYLHGGGFQKGNRRAYAGPMRAMARQGVFAATADYRLADGSPGRKFPAAVQDAACAVRWIKAHAAEYRVDPRHIAILGGSAGGNLALMVALAPELADAETNRPYAEFDSRVCGAINFCGPTDYLRQLEAEKSPDRMSVFRYLRGGTLRALRASARAASPIYQLDPADPPVLSLHVTGDRVVPFANAEALDEAMKAAGLSHVLVPIVGDQHAGVIYQDQVDRETVAFLRRLLSDPPAQSATGGAGSSKPSAPGGTGSVR